MTTTIEQLRTKFSDLAHTLANPDLVIESCAFLDVLHYFEQPSGNKVLDAIEAFKQELLSWPAPVLPAEIIQLLTAAIASPEAHSSFARLRFLWLLDQCTSRFPHVEAFVRFWLPQETDPDLVSHMQSHTLPSAILLGPNSHKTLSFQELLNSITDDYFLPQAFFYYSQWDPNARQALSSGVLARLTKAEALQAQTEAEIAEASVSGRFCPERYAAIIAKKHIGAAGPVFLLESLNDSSIDPDLASALTEALVGWPEEVSPLIQEHLDQSEHTWTPDILAYRERLQQILDRRAANAFLSGLNSN